MKNRLLAAVLLICVLCGCAPKAAEPVQQERPKERVLTLAVENGLSPYAVQGINCFIKKTEEISKGAIKIKPVSYDDLLEQIDSGVELIFGSNEEFARINGNFSAYTSPFYFYDYKHLTLTLNSPEYYDIIRNGNVSLMNAMPIGAFYDGNSVIISSREGMFDTVSQFNGSIVNIIEEQPLLELTFEAFGAEVKERSEEYILNNFGRRRDSAVMECDSLKVGGIEIDPKVESFYLCKSFHHARINWLMLSEQARGQLSDFEQAVITEATAYAVAKNDGLVLEEEERNFDKAKERGGMIIAPSYNEFITDTANAIKASAKYGSLWEWDQYDEVRNLALKQK